MKLGFTLKMGFGLLGLAHIACSSGDGGGEEFATGGNGGDGSGGTVSTGGHFPTGGTGTGGATGGSGTGASGGTDGCHGVSLSLRAEEWEDAKNWCTDVCNHAWVRVFDPQGNEVPLDRSNDCEPYFLSPAGQVSAYLIGEREGSTECLAPGTYRAEMCARPGSLIEQHPQNAKGLGLPGLRPQVSEVPRVECTATGEPTCIEVSFEYPGSILVRGLL